MNVDDFHLYFFLITDLHRTMNVLEEDRVSLLSDDILINIISRLNLKDAVRSSALSRRWRYL